MTQRDLDIKYDELISSYLEIKPVLSDLYKRNGDRYVDAIMNEIRALNDHVARCYRDDVTIAGAYEELCKAEGHLKRLIYDCFKQLNILFYDYAADYESKYFNSHWLCVDNGVFWRTYVTKRQEIISRVEAAKRYESTSSADAFAAFQDAYVLQGEVYELLDRHGGELRQSWARRLWRKINSMKGWLLSTAILTVIPACIWECCRHWHSIIGWLSGKVAAIVHGIGDALVSW